MRLNADSSTDNRANAYPSVFRGREGKLNIQIIQFLGQNGPSLIYSVAQHLSAISETKIHYPTINRRIHQLLQHRYLDKTGTKMTKAGVPGDLYMLGLRGEFAALAGMPDWKGDYSSEPSPKEVRQLISTASTRKGSPFRLLDQIIKEGKTGQSFVEKELIPEMVKSVRAGFINIDAANEDAINSSFASMAARQVTSATQNGGSESVNENRSVRVKMLMHALEETIRHPGIERESESSGARDLKGEQTLHWANELKVFLRLYSVKFE